MPTNQHSCPAEDQMNLAKSFANQLKAGQPFDETTFRRSYFETLPSASFESPQLSEQCAKVLWTRLQGVSAEQFVIASKQERTLSALIYRVWGKTV